MFALAALALADKFPQEHAPRPASPPEDPVRNSEAGEGIRKGPITSAEPVSIPFDSILFSFLARLTLHKLSCHVTRGKAAMRKPRRPTYKPLKLGQGGGRASLAIIPGSTFLILNQFEMGGGLA